MTVPFATASDRLKCKAAIVTGATQGLGKDIARYLHACGASVTIAGRSNEQGEAIARELGEC